MTNEEKNKHAGIWHQITVQKIEDNFVYLEHKKENFTLPKNLIKHDIKPGDILYIKVLDPEQKDHNHNKLAKTILNSILGNK